MAEPRKSTRRTTKAAAGAKSSAAVAEGASVNDEVTVPVEPEVGSLAAAVAGLAAAEAPAADAIEEAKAPAEADPAVEGTPAADPAPTAEDADAPKQEAPQRADLLSKFVTPEEPAATLAEAAPVQVTQTGKHTVLPGDGETTAICVFDMLRLNVEGVTHQLMRGDMVTGPAATLRRSLAMGALSELD